MRMTFNSVKIQVFTEDGTYIKTVYRKLYSDKVGMYCTIENKKYSVQYKEAKTWKVTNY